MKELEMQDKTKPAPLPLDLTNCFDVTKHIRIIPPFQDKEVDNTFYILKKYLKIRNGH